MSNVLTTRDNNWEVYPEEEDILLQTANTYVDRNINVKGVDLSGYVSTTEKGAANGVATLGSDGKVPST